MGAEHTYWIGNAPFDIKMPKLNIGISKRKKRQVENKMRQIIRKGVTHLLWGECFFNFTTNDCKIGANLIVI
jgi:hypothetical protein